MVVTKKTIKTEDVTTNTQQELLDWGFNERTVEYIISNLMCLEEITIYKNDVNDIVDWDY